MKSDGEISTFVHVHRYVLMHIARHLHETWQG